MTVAILVEDLYEDLELWVPLFRLREAGHAPVLVGPQGGKTYASKHGYPARADLAAGDARASELGGVVIPGGYAPDRMRRHPPMVELVRELNDEGKLVAAICHGGWMLASADVVRGRRCTGFSSIADDLKNAGARFEDAEVVRDGNLVTSRTPDDLPAFCRTLLEVLGA
ncbi:MAG TPA: type 1 glutamine amidotransferase domain-containing protein [Candidatus Polarisedimenticolaceae bacterium]|nr:type 1 glutamine amidotransferase domain-containing protein [Candidatus Polarisedimenticolaceae bacterium]